MNFHVIEHLDMVVWPVTKTGVHKSKESDHTGK
jgi:hypothetical protein